ncbi:hypothetical protein CEP10_14980 [Cylindrospermopsis raciborskii S07]|uniref:hypothetical protein n=1 Tax=Cylindrospermopsis raciborskii TaxID=77022 RepID=UPI0008DD5FC9|nr:hypothetical protein [Cylindrospermopsis raciborskii]OHY33901.1 hypothetical protein BCV63_04770 [Cylindrospermopsis raciborskii CS-508]PNK03673.1 hypothetical protein CEP10_14980 [Cylindrospermopsis raciborskii S07]PNK04288.1 hypothetical protein CEP11_11745 [Cylindrospermopsis raciborskii S10]PNK09565.1 hypothetical protein CEP12_05310 [Cylindrospermopsis raciborskii S14]PNK14149.1 hypothetical protein CEP09_12235 [Cylindrospermopsis raciborskii S06]
MIEILLLRLSSLTIFSRSRFTCSVVAIKVEAGNFANSVLKTFSICSKNERAEQAINNRPSLLSIFGGMP